LENPEDSAPLSPPKKRLTDTSGGQALFVGLWMLGTLATIAALIAAFFLGRMVSGGGQDTVVDTPVSEPDAVWITPLTGDTRGVGEWEWFELQGGECVAGFAGAFAPTFTVVECALPHTAELVHARVVSPNPGEEFPGDEDILATAKEICDVSDRLNRDVASDYSDLIVDFSYPTTADQWDAGYRSVYCFVTRSSGDFMLERLSG